MALGTEMLIIFMIGRILVGGFYIFNGINHFKHMQMMVQYSQSQKAPAPRVMVPLTGAMLVVGGLSILLGMYPTIGIALVTVFLIPTAFIMHKFWGADQQTAMMQMPHFMKNLALAGSALMLLAIPQPWEMSILF